MNPDITPEPDDGDFDPEGDGDLNPLGPVETIDDDPLDFYDP